MTTNTLTATRPFATIDVRPMFFAALIAILISTLLNAAPVQIPFTPSMDTQAAPISVYEHPMVLKSAMDEMHKIISRPAKAPQFGPQVQKEAFAMAPDVQIDFRPVRLEIPAISLNVTIDAVSATTITNKGVANWLNESASLWNNQNLSFWGYDHGWKDSKAQPFSALSHLTIRDELFIYDQLGIPHGYIYESLTTVNRSEVSVMDTNVKNQVTLIASAGEDIRDAQGRIIDSTHRRIFTFRAMTLSESAMAGSH